MPKSKRQFLSVIVLGRKGGIIKALEFLLTKNYYVPIVVGDQTDADWPALRRFCRTHHIRLFSDDAPLYRLIAKNDRCIRNIDVVVSYLFWKKIRDPLIRLPQIGCINFHPAPLPDYKSRAGYNTAILDRRTHFGVTAHFINSETFDSGPIIKVLRFPMNPETTTAWSLEKVAQRKLVELFCMVLEKIRHGKRLPRIPNGEGLYLTARQLEDLKRVNPKTESLETIHRKIRAFFFPPHHGAYINIHGQKFTLFNEELLQTVAKALRKSLTNE